MTEELLELKTLHRRCPVCCASEGYFLGNLGATVFTGSPLPDHWEIISCSNCGFLFSDGDFSPATLEAYYAGEGGYWEGTAALYDPVADRKDNPVALLEPWLPSANARILDIGCGSGKLLQVFARHGYQHLHGVDPGYPENECAEMDLRRASIHSLPFEEPFDLVVSTHVLEHLWDVRAAVSALTAVVRQEGLVYIEVPDTEGYFTEHFTHVVSAAYEHINFFTAQSLTALLEEHDIGVLEVVRTRARYGVSEVPCLAVIGRKGGNSMTVEHAPSRDCALAFRRHLQGISFPTRALVPSFRGKAVYVWGITRYLQVALHYCGLDQESLTGLVDSLPGRRQNTVYGLPTYAPEHLRDRGSDAVVLINAFNAADEITRQLQEMGFQGEIHRIW